MRWRWQGGSQNSSVGATKWIDALGVMQSLLKTIFNKFTVVLNAEQKRLKSLLEDMQR
jgi:hypothetical protein